jgi:O-antigen/teichoic acid export membrane protein
MAQPARSRTLSQLLWVSSIRIALIGSWFLATVYIGRQLGVVAFGLYVYCQTIIKLLTGCLGDPLDMAVMRQGPLLLNSDRPKLLQLLRSAFWIRVAIGLSVLLIGIAFPAFLSRVLFSSADYQQLVLITAGGVLGDFLLRSTLGYFQIGQQFGRFMAVDSVWQAGRVTAVVALVLLHRLSTSSAVGLYVLMPYVAFAFSWFLLPADVRRFAPPHQRDLADVFHYGKWMAIALAMAAAIERLDVLLLEHFRSKFELGLYAAALTWAVIPDYINGIIQTVLGPKIAPAYAAGRFNQLQNIYLKYALPAGALFAIIAWPMLPWVLKTFMSGDYSPAANVCRLLMLSTLFNTVVVPLPEALMNFVAPRRVMIYNGLGLTWVAIGGVILIPRYGAFGAAMTILIVRLLVGTLVTLHAHRLARGVKPN